MPAIDTTKDHYARLRLPVPQYLIDPSRFALGQAEPAANTVTDKEVRAAYHKLAKILHPDKTGGNQQAAEEFKKVLEAYEVLIDPDQRRQYDGLRAQAAAAAHAAAAAQQTRTFQATNGSGTGRWVRPEDMYGGPQRYPSQANPQSGASFPQSAYTSTEAFGTSQRPQQQQTKPTESRFYHQPGAERPTAQAFDEAFPPPPQSERPQAPEPTPDLPENFDFSIYTFHDYFDNRFKETSFLSHVRKSVSEAKHELRKAQVAMHVATVNVQKFGSQYMRTMQTIHYEAELREAEDWAVWWKKEMERREQWLKAHEDMAKMRKSAEKLKVLQKRREEEARKRAAEQERQNVKMMAEGGKVEVIEIEDSDDDGETGVRLDEADSLIGDDFEVF